jgi:hypothetical protein
VTGLLYTISNRESIMTIRALGYIKFRSYAVHISKDSESTRLYCFKHNGHDLCDIASFDSESDCCDYILEPLRRDRFCIDWSEE